MEYANLQTSQHHQLQEQVNNNINGVPSTSLPIIAPTTLISTSCNWINPTLVLNNGTDVYQSTEIIPNSWLWRCSPTTTFTSQLEYFNYLDHHHHHLHDARSRAFTPRPSATTEYLPAPLNPNLIKEEEPSAPSMMNASFGHVFPSTTTTSSSSTRSPTALSPIMFPSLMLSSGDFNSNKYNSVQALDLLSSSPSTDAAKYCHNSNDGSQISYSPSSQQYDSNIDKSMIRRSLYGEQPMSHVQGHDHGHHDHHDMMQESRSTPSNTSNSIMRPGFFNEVTRTKRPSSFSSDHQQKESHAEANNKKSKPILRSSNPPLKVRKEKLGDRIAALHRLVAPFGKTDTASVLTEAIGYILFLHDQVQTLSMPYMKSMQSKSSRKMSQVHGLGKELEETEMKMDLRSRGLCLVPQSCASYLNGLD